MSVRKSAGVSKQKEPLVAMSAKEIWLCDPIPWTDVSFRGRCVVHTRIRPQEFVMELGKYFIDKD